MYVLMTTGNPDRFAWLVILPFALFELAVVYGYERALARFAPGSLRRLLADAVAVALVIGVIIGQFSAYRWVTHTARLTNHFVTVVIVVESTVSALFFSYIWSKRQEKSRDG